MYDTLVVSVNFVGNGKPQCLLDILCEFECSWPP
jgi:hypothetical protein